MAAPHDIGWGILGTGITAHRVARDLRLVKGARLAAVASRSAAKAADAARAMGAAQGVEGLDALLALARVDVVYIATPTHRHRDDCLAALNAGKHVLCEKPLAMTLADAQQIAEAATAAGLFCMEGLWTQFIPAVAEAERLIASGAIGAPRLLSASFGIPTRAAEDPAPLPDGGALLDRGCYPITLALRLMGQVTGIEGRIVPGPGGADLSGAATLSFAGGRTAVLAASLTDQLENRLFVGGSRGSLALDDITCPTLLGVTQAAAPSVTQPFDAGAGGRLREDVRRAIRGSAVLTRLKALSPRGARAIPCRGFGFTHELEEVQACIVAGRLQSAIHPLSRSLETLRIIAAIGRPS